MAIRRTKIVDAFSGELEGQQVCVKGWVRTRRGNKHVQFIALNDGSTIKNLQIVVNLEQFTEEQLKPITTGASLCVVGTLVASMGKGQSYEIQAQENVMRALAVKLQGAGHAPGEEAEVNTEIPGVGVFPAQLRIRKGGHVITCRIGVGEVVGTGAQGAEGLVGVGGLVGGLAVRQQLIRRWKKIAQ